MTRLRSSWAPYVHERMAELGLIPGPAHLTGLPSSGAGHQGAFSVSKRLPRQTEFAMFLLLLLLLVLFMFSGGGYYGYRRGMYGRRMGYGGIGLGWLVFLFVILFMMPRWGYATYW